MKLAAAPAFCIRPRPSPSNLHNARPNLCRTKQHPTAQACPQPAPPPLNPFASLNSPRRTPENMPAFLPHAPTKATEAPHTSPPPHVQRCTPSAIVQKGGGCLRPSTNPHIKKMTPLRDNQPVLQEKKGAPRRLLSNTPAWPSASGESEVPVHNRTK